MAFVELSPSRACSFETTRDEARVNTSREIEEATKHR